MYFAKFRLQYTDASYTKKFSVANLFSYFVKFFTKYKFVPKKNFDKLKL